MNNNQNNAQTAKQGPTYHFQNKRQQFSIEIRSQRRDQEFQKHRNQQTKVQKPITSQLSDMKLVPISEMNLSSQYLHNEITDPRYEAQIKAYRRLNFNLNMVEELRCLLQSANILDKHKGIIGIRKIMSMTDTPPIQSIIDANLIPILVTYLKEQNYPQLQLEASWALSNIASGTKQQCQFLIEFQIIPVFLNLLSSKFLGIVQQAVWAIGNLACNGVKNRDQILKGNGVDLIIEAMKRSRSPYLLEHGAWALSNMLRSKPFPKYEQVYQAIYIIAVLIAQKRIRDQDVVSDICWGISYNIKSELHHIDLILSSGFHKAMVEYLKFDELKLILPILRIAGRIVLGNEMQVNQFLSQPQIIDLLITKLSHPKLIIRAETCWVFSNLAAGSTEQVELLMKNKTLIESLINLLEMDGVETKTEICHFFTNLTMSANPQQLIQFYISNQIIPIFMKELKEPDPKYLRSLIEDLYALLVFGESFRILGHGNLIVQEIAKSDTQKILEQLQYHQDQEIYQDVSQLIQGFFTPSNSEMLDD